MSLVHNYIFTWYHMFFHLFFQQGDCVISNVLSIDLTQYPEAPRPPSPNMYKIR